MAYGLKDWLPLVGVLVGWFLNQCAQWFIFRRDERKAIGQALADLLLIRHRILALCKSVESLIQKFNLPTDAQIPLSLALAKLLPPDDEMAKRYRDAVTLVSAINPVLGFRLRSQDVIEPLLDRLRAIALQDRSQSVAIFAKLETYLLSQLSPVLEDLIRELARAHGWGTLWRTNRKLKQELIIPEEFFHQLMASLPKPAQPAPRSPVFVLDQYISQAPFRVAPEKAAQLNKMVGRIQLVFEDLDGTFRIDTVPGHFVRASVGALHLLRCASYIYWLLYEGYIDAQKKGALEFRASGNPVLTEGIRLYEWALNAVSSGTVEAWPEGAPRPEAAPTPNSAIHVACEIFLVAVAWYLLHEIGHVTLKHPAEPLGPTAKQEEYEADYFATDWVLSGVTESTVVLKRALGIAVANVVLLTTDLLRGSFDSDTHPPSYDRLHRNLRRGPLTDEHPVHAFADVLLMVNMKRFDVPHVPSSPCTFDGILDDLCFQIHDFGRRS